MIVLVLLFGVAAGLILPDASAPAFAHRLAQQPLDLGVDRTKVVGGPLLKLLPQLGISAQGKLNRTGFSGDLFA